jgi:hypothetical protein
MPWAYQPSLPVPRVQFAAATFDAPAPESGSWIYAIGGSGDVDGTPVATVEAYDTSAKHWSPINPMHTARRGLAAAAGPDGLHALAGLDPQTNTATHEIYDPATGQWSPANPLPTARAGHAAVIGPDGLIYAIGGSLASGSIILATVDAYDPTTTEWIPKRPMPTARSDLAAVTGLDGAIYAIGGTNSKGQPLSTVEAYYPSADIWITKTSLPAAIYGLAAAVDPKGLIYAISGVSVVNGENILLASVYSYDPARVAAGWTEQEPLLTEQAGLAAATGPDGLLYAIGGGTRTTVIDTVEAYTPPDPCAAIAAQLESFNEADWENPQAALAGFRALVSALRECLQQHGGWPVIRG